MRVGSVNNFNNNKESKIDNPIRYQIHVGSSDTKECHGIRAVQVEIKKKMGIVPEFVDDALRDREGRLAQAELVDALTLHDHLVAELVERAASGGAEHPDLAVDGFVWTYLKIVAQTQYVHTHTSQRNQSKHADQEAYDLAFCAPLLTGCCFSGAFIVSADRLRLMELLAASGVVPLPLLSYKPSIVFMVLWLASIALEIAAAIELGVAAAAEARDGVACMLAVCSWLLLVGLALSLPALPPSPAPGLVILLLREPAPPPPWWPPAASLESLRCSVVRGTP